MQARKPCVICCAFLAAPRFCSVRGIQPQLGLLSFFSLRPSCSLLHRNLDVIFGILSLVSTHRPRPGCEDRRAHGERHVPIRPGDWPSKRQRRPVMCCRRREDFFMGDQSAVLPEAAALCKTLSLCAGRGVPQTSALFLKIIPILVADFWKTTTLSWFKYLGY